MKSISIEESLMILCSKKSGSCLSTEIICSALRSIFKTTNNLDFTLTDRVRKKNHIR